MTVHFSYSLSHRLLFGF